MADPQSITYTPQYQPPDWQDTIDLVVAGGPDGFNAQFQSLRGELDMFSRVVQQLGSMITNVSQMLNNTQPIIDTANTLVAGANTTVNDMLNRMKLIRCGYIYANGNIATGSNDFTVTKVAGATGLYDIIFQPAFTTIPSVHISVIYPANVASTGGSVFSNSVIVGLNAQQCRIKIGDLIGMALDSDFNFLAHCPPA